LTDYNVYYNHSSINRADGVVMYISKYLNETTTTEEHNNFSFLSSKITLKDNKSIKITGLYRCHNIQKTDSLSTLKDYLHVNKNVKNHLIIGDYNIDLLEQNNIVEELLSNFLECNYLPYCKDITRPSLDNPNQDTCIDNVFIKSNMANINAGKYMDIFNLPLFIKIKMEKPKIKKA
jgi:hypothetical protein